MYLDRSFSKQILSMLILVGGRREAISFQPFKRLFDYINSYMAVIKNSEKCIICASFGVFIPNSEDWDPFSVLSHDVQ